MNVLKIIILKYIIFFLIIFSMLFSACENNKIELTCGSNTICIKIECVDTEDEDCLESIKADGKTMLRIIAEVPEEIDEDKNNITFKSATGNFVGELDSINPVVKAINGRATALLEIGNIPGNYRVEAEVSDGTNKYIDFDYVELNKVEDGIIEFDFGETDFSTIKANGETVIILKTKINQVNPINKKLNLRLDGEWSFVNQDSNEVEFTLNTQGEVESFLRVSNEVGQCFLTAEFDGFQNSFSFDLATANPESLILVIEPPQSIQAVNGSININAYLYRPLGLVSINTPIAFKATQELQGSNIEVGSFNPPIGESDSNEISIVTLNTPADSTISSIVPIKIKAWSLDNPSVQDSINIIVN